MNRRTFLAGLCALGITAGMSNLPVPAVSDEVRASTDTILGGDLEKYKKSLKNIGTEEMTYFLSYFRIPNPLKNPSEFVESVIGLQAKLGFSEEVQDGIIGPQTLRAIYTKVYARISKQLPEIMQKRLSIYNDMQKYSHVEGALYGKLNVFNNNHFFGRDFGWNTPDTYINEHLYGHINEYLPVSEVPHQIRLFKYQGKVAVAMYINRNLHVATFVSPGSLKHKTPVFNGYGQLTSDMLHVSSSYPKNDETQKEGGAVMPYAIHINGDIRLHGSDSKIDGTPASHGCIRVGLYYIEEMYRQVLRLGKENVRISTKGVY